MKPTPPDLGSETTIVLPLSARRAFLFCPIFSHSLSASGRLLKNIALSRFHVLMIIAYFITLFCLFPEPAGTVGLLTEPGCEVTANFSIYQNFLHKFYKNFFRADRFLLRDHFRELAKMLFFKKTPVDGREPKSRIIYHRERQCRPNGPNLASNQKKLAAPSRRSQKCRYCSKKVCCVLIDTMTHKCKKSRRISQLDGKGISKSNRTIE